VSAGEKRVVYSQRRKISFTVLSVSNSEMSGLQLRGAGGALVANSFVLRFKVEVGGQSSKPVFELRVGPTFISTL
jgi:hypothetical protein